MNHRIQAAATVVFLLAGAGLAPAARAQLSFTGVGVIPGGPGGGWSYVNGVSHDGRVAVGNSNGRGSDFESMIWTRPGPAAPTGHPNRAEYGNATAVSGDGRFVTGYHQFFPSTYRGFRWSADGGYEDLGDLPGGPESTTPAAMSPDGRVIVGQGNYSFTGSEVFSDAFIWTKESGIRALPDLGQGGSGALGVSNNGRVVVGYSLDDTGYRPVRWVEEDSVAITLPDLPGGSQVGNAYGVSGDGRFMTGFSFSSRGAEAVLWKDFGATAVALGDLPGGAFSAIGLDVTDDGSMVVGYGAATAGERGFIWDAVHGLRDAKVALQSYGLNLTGWTIDRVNSISPDGLVLAGDGTRGGRPQGWVAIIPAPGPLSLAAAVGAVFARRRR